MESATDYKLKDFKQAEIANIAEVRFCVSLAKRQHLCTKGFYTPLQSDTAGRMNRTLPVTTKYISEEKCVAIEFWADVIITAAYMKNRLYAEDFS